MFDSKRCTLSVTHNQFQCSSCAWGELHNYKLDKSVAVCNEYTDLVRDDNIARVRISEGPKRGGGGSAILIYLKPTTDKTIFCGVAAPQEITLR